MIQEKAGYKRYSVMGPGGRRCSCCYPAPGPTRRLFERAWKKDDRRAIDVYIREALEESSTKHSE